jgi:hypothetical protein
MAAEDQPLVVRKGTLGPDGHFVDGDHGLDLPKAGVAAAGPSPAFVAHMPI